MKYTVQYFIDKFTNIPYDKWCTGSYAKETMCCALGHCDCRSGVMTEEGRFLISLINAHIVNDGLHFKYVQATPKDRVLAALEDLKNGNYQHNNS